MLTGKRNFISAEDRASLREDANKTRKSEEEALLKNDLHYCLLYDETQPQYEPFMEKARHEWEEFTTGNKYQKRKEELEKIEQEEKKKALKRKNLRKRQIRKVQP